ncbi:MAG: hypothetical protein M1838_005015 [Thelocarpon superellum]|nr:MAG: hypothetical protein M1838_005015 [Thelocarpon superellum]
MTRKRKRRDAQAEASGGGVRAGRGHEFAKSPDDASVADPHVDHPLLRLYYTRIVTLRTFVLSKCPSVGKNRRRKLSLLSPDLLDRILIARVDGTVDDVGQRTKDLICFRQRRQTTWPDASGSGACALSELLDFAIWLLFNKIYPAAYRPPHLLCHGFQRSNKSAGDDVADTVTKIPGLVERTENPHLRALKRPEWGTLLRLLGDEGEHLVLDLLLNAALFVAIDDGGDNYFQLSGTPMADLIPLAPQTAAPHTTPPTCMTMARSPGKVTFVRSRMLYAKAALNQQGRARFGLGAVHVLNRYPFNPTKDHTLHHLKYMFPRQFGLHNVFTSTVDPGQSVQSFQDYTVREQEIQRAEGATSGPCRRKIPRRLRGPLPVVIRMMQQLHKRCAYAELLEHYCPPPRRPSTTGETSTLMLATPAVRVSAFCRAVLSRIIPRELWGCEQSCEEHWDLMRRNVHRFVTLRRFESPTLHDVLQGFKIGSIPWLQPTSDQVSGKLAQTDVQKRWEIWAEFVYYVFDSLLIPLIRSNFHVTESNVHRNRLLFFRHDVWRSVADAALASLRSAAFEEVPLKQARQTLDRRSIGFSRIRLLPKATGFRPIINLRRRAMKQQHGRMVLGRSINSVMTPVYNMLNYEKATSPQRLGSSLFSVGDMYARLKAFQHGLQASGLIGNRLYFAKVDVQACFDTLPQQRVLDLMDLVASQPTYRIERHVELRPPDVHRRWTGSDMASKPRRRFVAEAAAATAAPGFQERAQQGTAQGRRHAVFVDQVVGTMRERDELLALLREHVEGNLVKMGKRFYRQKAGIPQGSVVSTLLCNFFYADFEREHLAFLLQGESLLLRLTDDFLLITQRAEHATRFLQVMHQGHPDYGVTVNADKSLVNFEACVGPTTIRNLGADRAFPYCGNLIDPTTLEVRKDRTRRTDVEIADSLTVEFSKVPGMTFHRKVLNSFKIQTSAMLLDMTLNSASTVLRNVFEIFFECAMKFYQYVKGLAPAKQPRAQFLERTILDLIDLAVVLMKGRGRRAVRDGYRCTITKAEVTWFVSAKRLAVTRWR